MREGYKAESLAIGNRIRGLLAEFGMIVAKARWPCAAPWRPGAQRLPVEFNELLRICATLGAVPTRPQRVRCTHRSPRAADDAAGGCARIVGIGPITADAAVATVGDARDFKHGRQMAAWLGLVPTQHSSGGHARWARSAAVAMRTCAPC